MSVKDDGSPPYRTFIEEHRPQLRFHYGAIAHLLGQLLLEEAHWDAFFEHCGIKPVLVLYENFAADYERSTLNLLHRLELSPPEGFEFEPRMKRQADGINDDWVRRYSDLKLGTIFDLIPACPSSRLTDCFGEPVSAGQPFGGAGSLQLRLEFGFLRSVGLLTLAFSFVTFF